jgi:hypothetical protein
MFSNQKSQIGQILEGFRMEKVGTYIVRPFGKLILQAFSTFLWPSDRYMYMLSIVLVYCVKKNLATQLSDGEMS